MSKQPKYLFVSWCPHDALQGMEALEPMEELAYRRILDFIYTSRDRLEDDDRRLARISKTGRRWARIKETLVRLGKLQVENGRITNDRCKRELAAVEHRLAEAKRAGKASAEARKRLKEQATGSTDVPTDVPTERGTDDQLTHKPIPSLQEGRAPASQYAFDGKVIQLNAKDLTLWRQSFPNVDLLPWLASRDAWLASRGSERDRRDWFRTTAKALEKQQATEAQRAAANPRPAPRSNVKPGQDPLTGRTRYQQRYAEWLEGGRIGPEPSRDEAA